MNDLKEDAQSLFEAGRHAHEPTSHDHERVLRGVLARGAAAASLTSATVGSAAAKGLLSAGKLAAVTKIFVGLAIFSAAGAGAYRRATSHAVRTVTPATTRAAANGKPQPASRVDARARAQSQPTTDTDSAATAAVVAAAKPHDAAPASVRSAHSSSESNEAPHAAAITGLAEPAAAATRSFPAAAAPFAPASVPASSATLSREARALADVQRALREGRSTEALALLERQSQEFPGGALGQEREAARVVALCAAGRAGEAHVAAERFLAANPSSPVSARIRGSCAFP